MSDIFSTPYFSSLLWYQFKSEGLLNLRHFSKFEDVSDIWRLWWVWVRIWILWYDRTECSWWIKVQTYQVGHQRCIKLFKLNLIPLILLSVPFVQKSPCRVPHLILNFFGCSWFLPRLPRNWENEVVSLIPVLERNLDHLSLMRNIRRTITS